MPRTKVKTETVFDHITDGTYNLNPEQFYCQDKHRFESIEDPVLKNLFYENEIRQQFILNTKRLTKKEGKISYGDSDYKYHKNKTGQYYLKQERVGLIGFTFENNKLRIWFIKI